MSWRFVGGSDNLSLVLNPLFIEVCEIFSWRLGVLSKIPGFLLYVFFYPCHRCRLAKLFDCQMVAGNNEAATVTTNIKKYLL